MYFIIDLDAWWSYKKSFKNFKDAFMIQQLVNNRASIEYWDGDNREIVWNPKWEEVVCH